MFFYSSPFFRCLENSSSSMYFSGDRNLVRLSKNMKNLQSSTRCRTICYVITKTTYNILFKIIFISVRHKAENATDQKAKTIFSSIESEATDDRCTHLL